MRILLASDKYKGSLTAPQVAAVMKRVIEQEIPGVECDVCPIADGGEGTTEALVTALQGSWVEVPVVDARGRPVTARYGLVTRHGHSEAVMEMSAASGLAMVSDLPLEPSAASTFGTGLMMLDALQRGAQRILIGIGGSATNDGGTGMAAALGYQFLDSQGQPLTHLPADLLHLETIRRPTSLPPVEIQVACDVNNPLLGPLGCTRVYGPQKGVEDFTPYEERLARLAAVVRRDLGIDAEEVPGAGAAGGLGYGLLVFGGARLISGFDLVAQAVNLPERIAAADLVITGEGRLDTQTLHGKGPVGLAQSARALGKKVAAFAGAIDESPALREHFHLACAISPADMPLAEAISRAEELLEAAVRSAVPELRALLA